MPAVDSRSAVWSVISKLLIFVSFLSSISVMYCASELNMTLQHINIRPMWAQYYHAFDFAVLEFNHLFYKY